MKSTKDDSKSAGRNSEKGNKEAADRRVKNNARKTMQSKIKKIDDSQGGDPEGVSFKRNRPTDFVEVNKNYKKDADKTIKKIKKMEKDYNSGRVKDKMSKMKFDNTPKAKPL
jgi:hypothetical protein